MSTQTDEKYLTVEQAAERLQFHRMSIYRMTWSGELPSSKVRRRVRIREQDLQDLMNRSRRASIGGQV
jgi:excisionase family DNA binding protein